MPAPIPSRSQRQRRAQARELARTPVVDPYRGQLADPFADPTVRPAVSPETTGAPADPGIASWTAAPTSRTVPAARPFSEPDRQQIADIAGRFSHVRVGRSPQAAVFATVLGFILAAAMAVYALGLLFLVSVQDQFAADPSFSADSTTELALMAFVDVLLAAGFVAGSVSLTGGRVAGRILLTLSGWLCLGVAVVWLHRNSGSFLSDWLPLSSGLAAALLLVLIYLPSITRWLGVLPPPQPR